jgi:erythromycin esterase
VLNDYVQGRSDDLAAAMDGFGMMIWRVEENRALLEDLRAWNEKAKEGGRVEIIGIDVQDPKGAAKRLHGLLEPTHPELASEAQAVAEDLVTARDKAYTGDEAAIAPARERAASLLKRLSLIHGDMARRVSQAYADEVMRMAREIARFPVAPSERGARDRGMGESLLEALAARGADSKVVLWGHNGHITKGPLRWMQTEETGCGGYVRAALGDEYYALGVAFGSGGFQALDRNAENKWRFRRYEHASAPPETVGHTLLAAKLGDSLLNFRKAPGEGPVRVWLDGDIGMRSWGGHRVPADPDAAVEKGHGLAWTILSADFDGLLFLKQTTSARPIDQDRIWQ